MCGSIRGPGGAVRPEGSLADSGPCPPPPPPTPARDRASGLGPPAALVLGVGGVRVPGAHTHTLRVRGAPHSLRGPPSLLDAGPRLGLLLPQKLKAQFAGGAGMPPWGPEAAQGGGPAFLCLPGARTRPGAAQVTRGSRCWKVTRWPWASPQADPLPALPGWVPPPPPRSGLGQGR